MGEPAPARSPGVARSTNSYDCPADPSHRAGSGEVSGGAAIADASWGRPTDGTGLRSDHRESRTVSVWQASGKLPGASAVGEIERESTPSGTYHETREHTAAFPAGGGSASDSAEPTGMAEQVLPPDDAARTENREGRDGTKAGGSFVLDDAQAMGLRAIDKIRFARGKARNRRWCAVEHREIDWVSRSPLPGSSK